MADEVLMMEARLTNHISGEIKRIETSLKSLDGTANTTSQNTGKAMSAVTGKITGMTTSLVTGAAAVAVAYKAWGMLTDSLTVGREEYAQMDKAQRQLTQSLGGTSAALSKQADSLAKLTLFEDDEIVSAQARLALYIKDEKAIERLTPKVLDFATAKGIDAAQAADLLARSIASETNALGRHGIKLDGAAGSTKRLESAMVQLDRVAGGQAEAMAKGPMASLKMYEKSVKDAQTALFEALLPAMGATAKYATDHLIPAITAASKALALLLDPQKARAESAKKYNEAIKENLTLEKQALEFAIAAAEKSGKTRTDRISWMAGTTLRSATLGAARSELKGIGSGIDVAAKAGAVQGPTASGIAAVSGDEGDKKLKTASDARIALKTAEVNAIVSEEQRAYAQLALTQELEISEYDKTGKTKTALAEKHAIEWGTLRMQYDQKDLEDRRKTAEDALKIATESATQVADAKLAFREAEAALIQDEGRREMEELKLRQEKELQAYGDNLEARRTMAEAHRLQILELGQKQASDTEKLTRQETRMKLDSYSQVASGFGNTLSMVAKASKASAQTQKRISQLEAIINTAVAASKANSATPYPPVNAALMAAAIIQGMAQVAIIEAQQFASGGIVRGPSSPVDTVPVLATGGEMMLNGSQQSNLFRMIAEPRTVSTSNSNQVVINFGDNARVDQNAVTQIEQLVRALPEALERAKSQGRLRNYEGM